jgi:hypothetical protein
MASIRGSSRRQRQGAAVTRSSLLGSLGIGQKEQPWTHVTQIGPAVRLDTRIQDRQRKQPIICATVPKWSPSPIADMSALADVIGDAELVLLERGDPNDELDKRLPKGLGVHDGALRIWFPFEHRGTKSARHPRLGLLERSEADAATEWVCDHLARYRVEQAPVPVKGEDLTATVSRVDREGVECTLASGRVVVADRLHVTRLSGLSPERVLRPGQTVVVRVADPTARPVRVSLVEHEPDPWQRIVEECRQDRVIACRVAHLRNFGALVEVLPEASGLVHKSSISDEWVSHPEEWLREGQLVAARIEQVDERERQITLTMKDVSEGELPARALSLYPGGPPWLDEVSSLHSNLGEQAEAADVPAIRSASPGGAPEPLAAPESDGDVGSVVPAEASIDQQGEPELDVGASVNAQLDAATREDDPGAAPAEGGPVEGTGVSPEGVPLAEGASEAGDAEDEGSQAGDAPGEEDESPEASLERAPALLPRLKREYSEVERASQRLAREIGAAEQRIVQYAEDRGLPAVLTDMRRSVEALRRQLEIAERERQRALDDALKATQRADEERRTREGAQRQVTLLERLTPNVGEGDLFIAECMECWESSTTPDDRQTYPWHAPLLGDGFLASLASVNVNLRQVASTCAHIASGRIHEIAGAALHELRTGKGPTDPQRRRADGAAAWRCTITASAGGVRLHYWQLPDGRVELAKVGYHDDSSI